MFPAQDSYATANAHLITIGKYPAAASVVNLSPMHYARSFATSVVAPDGKVYIFGGQVDVLDKPDFWQKNFGAVGREGSPTGPPAKLKLATPSRRT